MQPNTFRKLALNFSGAEESAHVGHPDFRVGGRIFATLGYPDEGWGMVRLTPAQQLAFIRKAPLEFEPAAGSWGRKGATVVRLSSARVTNARAALAAAFGNLRGASENA
jgi:hypothetical protein